MLVVTGILRALPQNMQTTPTLAEMLAIFVDSMIVAIQSASHDDERTLATCQDIEAEVCAIFNVEIVCESLANVDQFYTHSTPALVQNAISHVAGCMSRDVRADIDGALFRLANTGYSHSI